MAEYITKEQVIELARPYGCTDDGIPYYRFVSNIHKMKAADVAPVVHGEWLSWKEADNFIPSPDRHECSVCHDAAQVLVNGLELLSDYCPNCGARMDIQDGGNENG